MIYTQTATFVRPANVTAYTAADLVANSTTAASVAPMLFGLNVSGPSGMIRGIRLFKSSATVTNANFRLHLFNSTPGTPTNGDNGAFAIASAAPYLEGVGLDMTTGAFVGTAGAYKRFTTAIPFFGGSQSARMHGLLEALAAYTPVSAESFTVTLELEV